jgi:hypothetical protein
MTKRPLKAIGSSVNLLSASFHRDDGAVEWWGVYALGIEEAVRWAEHELRLRRRRRGEWHAEIVDGWIDQETETVYGSGETVAVVQMPARR